VYFAGAVPYLRLKREGGALPYFTGAQLYLSGAETVEYSGKVCRFVAGYGKTL